MREVLLGADNDVKLLVASDGVEALAVLRQQGTYVNAPRPDLILLDLNLPRMNGHKFVACMKADADLGMIPAIVVTSSEAEADVVKSYQLHASCFIRKPGQLNEFDMLVKSLSVFG